MSDFQQAADDLNFFITRLQGVIALVATLRNMPDPAAIQQNIDRLRREERSLVAGMQKIAATQARADAKAELENELHAARQDREQATQDAAVIVANAKREASQIIADAKRNAEELQRKFETAQQHVAAALGG